MAKKHIWTDETFKKRVHELHPTIEVIGAYTGTRNKILCRCRIHNHYWSPMAYTLLKDVDCPICGFEKIGNSKRFSNEDFLKKLNEKFLNLEPLEEYINSHTPILFKCLDCGNEFKRSPNNLFNSSGCKCQQKGWVVIGENDFKSRCPELVRFLCDKSDAEKYSYSSSKKIKTKCPLCGYIHEMKISQLSYRGFNCPICGDNVSFPNKFGRAFVEQLPVENIFHEKMLEIPNHRFRFDTYFEYESQKYAVEFDGLQHYEECGLGRLKEQQKLDKLKDKYAEDNNITLVRIDCRKSDGNYIKDNILKSLLNEIFDLSNIDWGLCNMAALKSLTKEICNQYNSTKMSIQELANHFHLSESTISSRLKTGTNLGFTDYYSEENIKNRRSEGRIKTGKKFGKEVVAFYSNGDIYGVYDSASQCSQSMSKDLNKKFTRSAILNICNHKPNKHTHHGFTYLFKTEYDLINNLKLAI